MASEWHKEEKSKRFIGRANPRKGEFKPMPANLPELIDKYRLEGWSKPLSISKAGGAESSIKRWKVEHQNLRDALDRFKKPRK